MIEDKKDGIKIALTREEAFWENLRSRIEQETIQSEAALELNKITLPYIEEKLKELANGKKRK